MVLESLSSSLKETFRKISGASYISPELIKETVKDIQRALLKSDVNVKLALSLSKKVEQRSLEEKPPQGMPPQDFILKIIYEELLSILGEESKLKLQNQTIMLVGLYGQGKTTHAGKLSRFFIRKGLSCGLIACDVHRPAAYEQLQQIAKQTGAKFFGIPGEKNPVKIYRASVPEMKEIAVKIVDTSGRDSLDEELLKELVHLKKEVNPDEILLVMDATIGQQAGIQARALQETVGITGVIITKMDGTGKGGGALSAVAETGAPVYLIGTGEHIEDMEIFNPKKFLQRLLGMGDIEAIMEIAQETDITEEKAEETLSKMMSGKFNLMDMYEIWEKFSKPSILKRLFESLPLAKIPGAAKAGELDLDQAENRLSKYRVMLDSMTYYELENPDEINAKRIKRVARGSGSTEADVRHMLKEFKSMKENVKMMKGNRGFRKMLKAQMKSGSAFNLDEE